jgi:hypothetical protein
MAGLLRYMHQRPSWAAGPTAGVLRCSPSSGGGAMVHGMARYAPRKRRVSPTTRRRTRVFAQNSSLSELEIDPNTPPSWRPTLTPSCKTASGRSHASVSTRRAPGPRQGGARTCPVAALAVLHPLRLVAVPPIYIGLSLQQVRRRPLQGGHSVSKWSMNDGEDSTGGPRHGGRRHAGVYPPTPAAGFGRVHTLLALCGPHHRLQAAVKPHWTDPNTG